MSSPHLLLTCRLCGRDHERVRLAPGERALCARCGAVLAKGVRASPASALAFTLSGLILAVPATLLPLVTAEKVGDERVAYLFTGIERLWKSGMRAQAIPVFLFGGLLPLVLMGALAGLLLAPHAGNSAVRNRLLATVARALRHWAMPEVQVLAVLVAIVKLGSMVTIRIGPGFWCYAAMSGMLLLAYRSYDLDPALSRDLAGAP